MSKKGQQGFTLIELIITMAILAPIMLAILSTNTVVSNSVSTTESASRATQRLRVATRRLTRFIRPASLSSLKVRQYSQSLQAIKWTMPPENAAQDHLQFQLVSDVPSTRTDPLSAARTIEFLRDPREKVDGKDNDSDGLIDEGNLFVRNPSGARGLIARNVEAFSIMRVNRTLTVTLQVAHRDRKGVLHRAAATETVYLRNN